MWISYGMLILELIGYRPDIVIHDSFECSAILIDVAIPADVNIVDEEREKILKYVDLRLDLYMEP